MDDLKILIHARHYIGSMANGINPLNGEYAPQGDTISQERIQKCCSYVANILDKLIENGGEFGRPKRQKFSITPQQISKVEISAEPIGINEFAKRINAATDKNMRGISGAKIASWLAENGYLTVVEKSESVTKTHKVTNERSAVLGITMTELANVSTGEIYQKILYSPQAQRFILDNIDRIMSKE